MYSRTHRASCARAAPRRLATLGLALVVTLGVAWGAAGAARADGPLWRVQRGDALSVVAHRFGVTVDDLRSWNGIEGDTIYEGQELRVAPTPQEEPIPGTAYVVSPGDTASGIAAQFGTTLAQLRAWNPELRPDRIRVGDELRVGIEERRRVEYRVHPGDSLSRIAARNRVSVPELLRWNARLRPDRLHPGRVLTIYTDAPQSLSASIGAPNAGRLAEAVAVRPHPLYVIRDPELAWGTEETADWVSEAFDAVRETHGLERKVRLHDVSAREGGTLAGHVSHQSGRDLDLSFFQRRCYGQPCPMRRVSPDDLDVERQWTLLRSWLERGRAEAIFMDYELQAPLYRHARAQGASREQLHRWFQYPRGRAYPLGTIRHYPRHRDHVHVRFACHETDEACR